jgi:hypothetical protein
MFDYRLWGGDALTFVPKTEHYVIQQNLDPCEFFN